MSVEPLRQRWPAKVRAGIIGDHGSIPRSFLIILILSLFLFGAALWGFNSQYETNDDAAMNMYAAGKGLGEPPSEFLLFQHFIIGLTLKFLYIHLPQVPWYGMLLYAYLVLSSLIIGYAISRLNPRFSAVGLWIMLFVLFYLKVIVSPQFTICAGYLAIAGILLLYSTLYRPYVAKTTSACLLAIALGLLILAGLVRFYSLLLVLLSMAPLYLYALVTRCAITLRRLLPILCCVVVVSELLNWAQLAYYKRSPGWELFYNYNNIRAEFIDRHKIAWDESTQPVFEKVGWSRNDLAMLKSWFYVDQKMYSFRNLLFISQHTSLLPRAKVAWATLFTDLKQSLASNGGMATLLLSVLLLTKSGRIVQGFAVLALLWYGALFVGITVVERHMPVRVWLVMLLGVYVTEWVLWCQVSQKTVGRPANTVWRLSKSILFLLVLAFYTACCWVQTGVASKVSDAYRFIQIRFRQDLAHLRPHPNQLFVTWGGDFPYQTFQLPTKAEAASSEMRFLGLGVGNHEPFVQNRLKAFEIDDLYQSFYMRDDVFLICREDKKSLLVQYIQEHYQTKVEVKTIYKGWTFTVNEVRKVI